MEEKPLNIATSIYIYIAEFGFFFQDFVYIIWAFKTLPGPNFMALLQHKKVAKHDTKHYAYWNMVTSQNTVSHVPPVIGILLITVKQYFLLKQLCEIGP